MADDPMEEFLKVTGPLVQGFEKHRALRGEAFNEIKQLAQENPLIADRLLAAGHKFVDSMDEYIVASEAAMSEQRVLIAYHTERITELKRVTDDIIKRFGIR